MEDSRKWIFVCFDQLSWENQLLAGSTPESTHLIFVETESKPRRRPYHKQKLVLLLSAMRHFAEEARNRGFLVHYVHHPDGYKPPLEKFRNENRVPEIHCLEIQEDEVRMEFQNQEWMVFHDNNLFLSTRDEFFSVFQNSKTYLQETFYRYMRKKWNILMTPDSKPVGGKWNYDSENRSNWKSSDPYPPHPPWVKPDSITRKVMDLVEEKFPDTYGNLDHFGWPVTRKDALEWLEHFIKNNLVYFGKYEDAMSEEEPFLFHSLLSPLIHLGLLHPREVILRALEEYESPQGISIPLESVEGFVRQILGWREYMRHIFHIHKEDYKLANYFRHTHPLPSVYWGEKSGMKCMDSTIQTILDYGYSHHITRLMVLSNFANLLGVDPEALNEWFWFAYVDAYEWVVTPNVKGMGTYSDGGICSTKPYIASANYIKKMAPGFCKSCSYKATGLLEDNACPLNSLYWNFIGENENHYSSPGRRDFSWSTWKQFPEEKKDAIRKKAKSIRKQFLKKKSVREQK